jgi:hypothetical protein
VKVKNSGITVTPVGGLGNQLFIYSLGYALSSRLGCELYIDRSWFATQALRNYELTTFASVGIELPERRWETGVIRLRKQSLLASISRKFGRFTGTTLREEGFGFDERILSAGPGVRLEGYFQSHNYFSSAQESLRQQMRAISQPSVWYSQTKERLDSVGPWVAVHVRRGDYLNPGTRDFHGIVEKQYYLAALEIVNQIVPGLVPIVFSDEPALASQMLADDFPAAIFIENSTSSKPIETINLMARSQAVVMANSSFSWWGGWLGDSDSRPVVGPRPWFNSAEYDERDLLPSRWISLGR